MNNLTEAIRQVAAAAPKAGYLAHKAEIDAAVQRVLESGWYILGEEVAAFEEEFAAWNGSAFAVGVASGTDALELALRACEIGAGDVVLTVSNTAVATVAAIARCGATPLFVEIEPETFTMAPDRLDEAIQRYLCNGAPHGTLRAIIPVHLYGHPAAMPAIMQIARRYELAVVEDCAQAHGAIIDGRKVGTWGDLGAFSFYPTKNLGALGDGGAVLTDNAALAERLRLLQQYGWRERYISQIEGVNSRLDPLQAAILRVKLRHLHAENRRRQRYAARYDAALAGSAITPPVCRPSCTHVYHQYVCRSTRRDEARKVLQEAGIGTQILYPMPIHQQPAYIEKRPLLQPLPETEAAAREIFTVPVHAGLSDDDTAYVVECLRRIG